MNHKPKFESTAITHLDCVFNDPDFIKSAKTLAKELGISKTNRVGIITVTEYDNEIAYITDDYENKQITNYFIGQNSKNLMTKNQENKIKELAQEYKITFSDLIDYMSGIRRESVFTLRKPTVVVEQDFSEGVTIKLFENTTKQDIKDVLDSAMYMNSIHHKKRLNTKQKPPQNYKLVYAIFRARKMHKTFREIFDQYQNGKLPLYSGSSSQYKSEDSLERYYRKYAPKN